MSVGDKMDLAFFLQLQTIPDSRECPELNQQIIMTTNKTYNLTDIQVSELTEGLQELLSESSKAVAIASTALSHPNTEEIINNLVAVARVFACAQWLADTMDRHTQDSTAE